MFARTQLGLAAHVRACHSDGQVILLDLHNNKYLGVGGQHLPALASAVKGWPECPSQRELPASGVNIDALTTPLIRQGLLTNQPTAFNERPTLQHATGSLNADDAIPGVSTGPRRVWRFLWSAACASLWLRYRSLFTIANGVSDRRARLELRHPPASLDALRHAVGLYMKLRPLVFTAHDRCLYDSLALVHFLAGEGIPATWVIGVRTSPFAAHAWVQSGGLVLNDQHEHIRRFEPILVV